MDDSNGHLARTRLLYYLIGLPIALGIVVPWRYNALNHGRTTVADWLVPATIGGLAALGIDALLVYRVRRTR